MADLISINNNLIHFENRKRNIKNIKHEDPLITFIFIHELYFFANEIMKLLQGIYILHLASVHAVLLKRYLNF